MTSRHQQAREEWEALGLISYTSGIADITKDGVERIRSLIRELTDENQRMRDTLVSIRQWDMFNPSGLEELTADAPYWRREIDAALEDDTNPRNTEGQQTTEKAS